MSVNLPSFASIPSANAHDSKRTGDLSVTAFHGGNKYGKSVQLTVGNVMNCMFVQLSEAQTRWLIKVLNDRLNKPLPNSDSDKVIAP